MPQLIEVPGQGVVEFPDGMKDADIAAAIKRNQFYAPTDPDSKPPAESVGTRWAKVAGSAIMRGLATIPAMAAEAGMAEPRAFNRKPGQDLSGQAMTDVATLGTAPSTSSEKYVSSALEGAAGAIGPGGLAKNMLMGAGAGLGSEGAAHVGGDNPLVRLLGGLIGGGVTAGTLAHAPTSQTLTKKAVAGVGDADWRRARQLEQILESQNIPHLKSQLLGAGSSLDDVVLEASKNPTVRPKLLSEVRGVDTKAGQALNNWVLQHLPVTVDERRALMQGLQVEASDAVGAAKGRANAAYSSALGNTSSETYTPQYVEGIAQQLRTLAKDPAKYGPLAGGPFLEKIADEISDTITPSKIVGANGLPMQLPVFKGYINNLLKTLNTRAEAEGYKGLPLEELKSVIRQATGDFQPARDAKSAYMARNVEPMQQGLTGVIAQQGGGPRSDKYTAVRDTVGLVFPSDKAQPLAIRQLSRDMGSDTVGHLLGEHLTSNMNKASQAAHGKENSPRIFFDNVFGNKAARQNIEAGIMETAQGSGANPYAARNGFYDLMKAFASFEDLKLAKGVSGADLGFEAGKTAAGAAVAPQSRVARYLWERATTKTYQRIADMVTSKDGLAQLEAIARKQDPAYTRSVLLGTIAAAQGEKDSE